MNLLREELFEKLSFVSCNLMLRLNKIQLTQFKNYGFSTFNFDERVIGICGLNGRGKTNLLDAIYYLCFTKSYFSKAENFNVEFGSEGFRIEGNLSQSAIENLGVQDYKFVATLKPVNKKEVFLNDIPYEKFSHHLGKFPCVMIAPDDVEIVTGTNEERRKFIDTVLSQTDAVYLQQLIVYNKVLQQRNSLLKSFAETGNNNLSLLEVLDLQLVSPGNFIFEKRKEFTERLVPLAKEFYGQISDNKEEIEIKYESQLHTGNFGELLEKSRSRDLYLQRTSMGIHKDDLSATLNVRPFKNIASQGQRKSLLFSLKLAEYEILKQNKGFAPFLLLDDVFEKLDEVRMQNLLKWVCVHNQGQVFITDTHRDRLTSTLSAIGITPYILELP